MKKVRWTVMARLPTCLAAYLDTDQGYVWWHPLFG
jgi:hypothetical protein